MYFPCLPVFIYILLPRITRKISQIRVLSNYFFTKKNTFLGKISDKLKEKKQVFTFLHSSKGLHLGSNLSSDKASHKNSIHAKFLFQVFWVMSNWNFHGVYTSLIVAGEWMRLYNFYYVHNFFTATIVDNLFDNPALFKNVENFFLIDIMIS